MHVFFTVIVLALIAFACAPALAQEVDCSEEFFRVGVKENCQEYFICMVGGRVDFACDDGEIFDEERIRCRRGNRETCEFMPLEIPSNECDNDFLRVSAHPDPFLCGNFFICMNFQVVEFQCDWGFIYSEYNERCIPGDQETCEEAPPTPYDGFMHAIKV